MKALLKSVRDMADLAHASGEIHESMPGGDMTLVGNHVVHICNKDLRTILDEVVRLQKQEGVLNSIIKLTATVRPTYTLGEEATCCRVCQSRTDLVELAGGRQMHFCECGETFIGECDGDG